ncbi:RnfABCDGE type electron transport complex subunit B [Halomonas sp. HP20-15]|uniref:RnfABCDGE type electron transport complex subunit B n=1 Tax=Halomonas sp. HP20-15 TaxID=3085901 RepID=UPI002981394A|nr:RnfABCDGE type electron transport complex subunit B [Halomonas sp. HP20-15]MDW5377994.1 RnfABCDGE type electron transport complex subunit B [Halomonas sp. HP20-15]
MSVTLIDAIDAELPQTQCGKCGHPGCRPYAEAIAAGEAINRCPPGGERTVVRLAGLTGRPAEPLAQPAESPQVAVIREDECIGCTKCIQACPVDAILGAAKQMHTVLAGECTGCELCVAPCPVDCIDIVPHPDWQMALRPADQEGFLARRATLGRRRFEARQARLRRQADERRQRRERRQAAAHKPAPEDSGPPADAATLKASRATLAVALKRLERKRQRTATDDERRELDTRIAEHRTRLDEIARQLDGQTPPAARDNRQRLAQNAAEQALRRARAQLAHAERQHDTAAIDAAHVQIAQAQAMRDAARQRH